MINIFSKPIKKILWIIPFATVLVTFFSFATIVYSMTKNTDVASIGQFGDSFGVLNSLFSGLGFSGIIMTIYLQQKQFKSQDEENKKLEQERMIESKKRDDEHVRQINFQAKQMQFQERTNWQREREQRELIKIQEKSFVFQKLESDSLVKERRSLFNLNSAIEAFDAAETLLKKGGNDRSTWIRAGRLLKHAKKLTEEICIENHQITMEIKQLHIRAFFSNVLVKNPAEFYYGVGLYGDIDEAFKVSKGGIVIDGINVLNGNSRIPESTIKAVWEAGQWPEEYLDPLGDKFTEAEHEKLFIRYRNVSSYFSHLNRNTGLPRKKGAN